MPIARPIHRIAWFFVVGLALLIARSLWPEPGLSIVVHLDGRSEAQAVAEDVLLDQGYRAGWVHTDPVIRGRLADNLRFTGMQGTDDALVEEAIRLGMDTTDHVVRERLRLRAERLLDTPPEPTDTELAEYLAAHPERFARPGRVRLDHVFLSADLRSDLQADAAELGARLAREPGAGWGLGDPSVLLGPTATTDPATLDARLGGDFGARVAALPTGSWQGPLPSTYGLHFVRVHEATPGAVPPLAQIRAQVAVEWRQDHRQAAYEARLADLVARYDVEVVP